MLINILNQPKQVNKLFISLSQIRNINLFFLGFVIYILSLSISATPNINHILCQIAQLIGLLLFCYAAIHLIKFRFESSYLKLVYTVYLIWLLVVILRGISFDYDYIKQVLFDSEIGIFLYLVPLVILFPRNVIFYKRLFDVIFVLNIFYLIYIAFFIKQFIGVDISDARSREVLEVFSKNLSIPAGYVLLTYMYHTKKIKLLSFFVITLTIIFALLRARRGLVFMGLSIMSFSYIMYSYVNKAKSIHALIALSLVLFLSAFIFLGSNAIESGIFSSFASRLNDDSRTGVELCFFDGMSKLDWIIGKGMNGQYYCPNIDAIGVNYRSLIETGYLNIILKGGVIGLLLLLMILIPAMFNGFFKSRNILCKGAALWILLWIIYSHPSTVATFSLNYLLVWVSVGICYSSAFRTMSNESIKELFRFIEKRNIFNI